MNAASTEFRLEPILANPPAPAESPTIHNDDALKTSLRMDPDVQRVLEFMQRSMSADKLVPVAAAIARIAPVLWDRYGARELHPMRLEHPSPC